MCSSDLDDIVFGAWDPFRDNAYQAALKCGVLNKYEHIEPIRDFLESVEPMQAAFDQFYVKRLDGPNVKKGKTKLDLAETIREDIRRFKERNGCDRLVMIWAASTEIFMEEHEVHANLDTLRAAMEANDPHIPSSMLYAYAALMEGVP